VGARRGNPAALAFTQKHAEAIADKVMEKAVRRGRRGG
jgi:membrane protein